MTTTKGSLEDEAKWEMMYTVGSDLSDIISSLKACQINRLSDKKYLYNSMQHFLFPSLLLDKSGFRINRVGLIRAHCAEIALVLLPRVGETHRLPIPWREFRTDCLQEVQRLRRPHFTLWDKAGHY